MNNTMDMLNEPTLADSEFALLSDDQTDDVSGGFIIAAALVISAAEIGLALIAREMCR